MPKEIEKIDSKVNEAIEKEKQRQGNQLEMIASENFTSKAVLEAQGSVLTNKYAEGLPKKRYYGGCQYVDIVEKEAIKRAKKIFNAEHVNVQPHSGTQANMAVYFSILEPGDKILGPKLSHGGHLSHGSPWSFSGKLFEKIDYKVDKETERWNHEEIKELAEEHQPDLIITGYSAYPREINFEEFKKAAEITNSYLMADIAHIAGLIAAGIHPNPFPEADIVTSTTHKTLRGARGGFIMCKEELSEKIDLSVFPLIQGGPLMHSIAGKAITFKQAMSSKFKEYQEQTVKNSKELAKVLKEEIRIVTRGTDNHLVLADVTSIGVTGKEAEDKLQEVGITVNKNTVPYDDRKPEDPSGIRIGTPALTVRGMKENEMREIGEIIIKTLKGKDGKIKSKKKVKELCEKFEIYG
ncbi:MAG: serine hydroxymethyltransferase [archaeon]